MAPTTVCHADWGSSPQKRWIARAYLDGSHYEAHAPELVGDQRTLITRAREGVGTTSSVLLGFDFPIGIPAAYAESIGVTKFIKFLPRLGVGDWKRFYSVCEKKSDISKYRPFYPFRPGGTSHKHLLSALDVNCIGDLRRQCDLKTAERNAACSLFWTLGANQVGKCAIVGWRDVIVPALGSDSTVKLWPFDGVLGDLLLPGNLVVAETYPAESCRWLLGKPLKGKGKLEVRKTASSALLRWAQSRAVKLQPDLKQVIEQEFPEGDDAFDAVIGLFGMLEVVLGHRATGEPTDKVVIDIEGWILGQFARALTRGFHDMCRSISEGDFALPLRGVPFLCTIKEIYNQSLTGNVANTPEISGQLEVLHCRIDGCRRCEACVPGFAKPARLNRGDPGRILFVGQGPGKSELKGTRAFAGQSGNSLEKWLVQAGANPAAPREGIYFTSVLKCFCPEFRYYRLMATNCGAFLNDQIALIRPRLIVTLGAEAYAQLRVTDDPYEVSLCKVMDTSLYLFRPLDFDFALLHLPHPSGANRWHNSALNRERLSEALHFLSRYIKECA